MIALCSFAIILSLVLTVALIQKEKPKQIRITSKTHNRRVMSAIREINQKRYFCKEACKAQPLQLPFEQKQIPGEEVTYFYLRRDSGFPPAIVIPPMFTVLPSCVKRLADVLPGDVYVLQQHGMVEQIIRELRNEYLSFEDIDSLIEVIERPVYLVGYSAGAMRAANYVCSKYNNLVIKVFALYTPFDPLMPIFFDQETEHQLGKPIEEFLIRNQKELIAQEFVSEQQLKDLIADCTMMKYDTLWANRYSVSLEEYYRIIQPKYRLKDAETEIFFFSTKQDEITGRLVPSTEELSNCSLVRCNYGKHLVSVSDSGIDIAALFVALMISEQ